MKKILSIFGLFARNTIYKMLLVFVAVGGIQIYQFWNRMQEQIALKMQPDVTGVGGSLELAIDSSNQFGWYTIAFVLVTVILGFSTCNWGSVQGYTLKRLRVSEWELFWMQSAYNLLCYVLLLGAQLGLLLVMGYLYVTHVTDATNQTLFLAFYRNDFMHSILPMEEWLRWCVNLLMLSGMSITVASVPYFQRNGKFGWEAVVAAGVMAVGFESELGSTQPYVITVVILICMAIAIRRVYLYDVEKIKANWVANVVEREVIVEVEQQKG